MSIHTWSLALRHSILIQSRKFLCAVIKMSSVCQTENAEVLIIENIFKIQKKS
jgi:hypothetical protein